MRKPLLTSVLISAGQFTQPITGRKNAFSIVGLWHFYGTSNEYAGAPITRQKENSLLKNGALRGGLNSVQQEIVSALDSKERDRASSLLKKFVCGKADLTADDFVHIMEYCSLKPDPLFVMETWNRMEENEIPLSGKCYHLLIQALCKAPYSLEEAFNILSTLKQNSVVTPTLPVYNCFLQASIDFNNKKYANDCLKLMELHAVGKNEITYSLRLKLAVLEEKPSDVHEIWNECIKMYPMSVIILRKIISAFTTLNDLESAYMVLQQMTIITSQSDFRFIQTAEGKLHLARLDIPIPYQLSQEKNSSPTHSLPEDYSIKDTHKRGLSLSKKPFSKHLRRLLRWSFNDLMQLCAKMKKPEWSEILMRQMQSLGLTPSSATYDGYVRALLFERGYRFGIEQLKVMQRNNWRPHESMLAAISVSCSKALELVLAEDVLDLRPICYAYPYNAFFEACAYLDLPEDAIRVFAKMKKLKVKPDIRTYELLFKVFGNVYAPYEDGNKSSKDDAARRIKYIAMDMVKHDIQHSLVSLENLMFALGAEGNIKELIDYLPVAVKLISHTDASVETRIYDIVLHSLRKAKETGMAFEIFKCLVSCGYPPNAAIYSIMIHCCFVGRCYKSARALVSMMIRGGFPLNRVTYTTLIKVALYSNDFGEAAKLLELAMSEGIQPDLVLYNTFLRRASETGNVKWIELIVKQMHQEKIQPDVSTCTHVVSAYAKQALKTAATEELQVLSDSSTCTPDVSAYAEKGLKTKAMEALQVLSDKMISEQADILEENKLKYESLILSEDLEAESKIFGVFTKCPTLAMALFQSRLGEFAKISFG